MTGRMLDLDAPIIRVFSVGTRSAARLARLGITTVRSLLLHLPARYEDFSAVRSIAEIETGQKQSIRGEVVSIGSRFIWPRRMTITTATVRDESGGIRAVWFNQPYLEDSLAVGTQVSLAGKVVLDKRGLYLANPSFEKIDQEKQQALRHTEGLVPIYPETEGVTSKYLRSLIRPLLEQLAIDDPLPADIRRQYDLIDFAQALRAVHAPDQAADVDGARRRLAFDELITLQIKALQERRLTQRTRAPRVSMDAAYVRQVMTRLPFKLTRDQRVALLELLRDMDRAYPMNRLLEGDVGSGKTVVALIAALHAARAGWQTVLLAPTDVLARQHYRTLLGLGDHPVALVTGASTMVGARSVSKPTARRAIASGTAAIVVGTHAVLERSVSFPKLALIVIDEQQRFGTAQRAALSTMAREKSGVTPHLLSMTATPIPRTLALTVFGDLDISLIREKPVGRQPITTTIVRPGERPAMEKQIREEVRKGRQVFVICSRIELSEAADVAAAEEEYKRLKTTTFSDLRVALLHGRMKALEKQRVMREFSKGAFDILVSTAVVEVGVDVPNATLMVIEGADRFGLAQLHQFRGRVGRAEHASCCFLVPTDDATGGSRLKAMTETDDGFKLAEHDLRTRGPGEFFGLRQSGMPDLAMAALADMQLVQQARTAARALLRADPTLKRSPLLKKRLESLARGTLA